MEMTFNVNVVTADVGSTMSLKGVPKIFKDLKSYRDMAQAMHADEEYSMHISWLENMRFSRVKLNQTQLDRLKKEDQMWADDLQFLKPKWWMRILEKFPLIRFGMWK
jgi:hypothetical protein